MKAFIRKYSHIWTACYALLYMPWFIYLEKHVTTYHPMHCALDDAIPFVEYFAIPYFIWFGFVAAAFVFLFFYSKEEYYRFCIFLFSGMTLFLIICTVFPNGQDLRTTFDADKNIFTRIVSLLYQTDTDTNVFPSIHAYNSIGVMIAAGRSRFFHDKRIARWIIYITGFMICLSTVFLKQHSVLDVFGAIGMALIFYWPAYVWYRHTETSKTVA